MNDRRQFREWIHGLTALILGLFLLAVGANLGISKTAVDLLGGALSIPEYPAVWLREWCQDWWSWARDRTEMQDEIARLRDENAKLRVSNGQLLSEQIRLESEGQPDIARVTLRAPMSWWNEIRIDRGSSDKVTQGMPIFSQGYLVGRVSSVSMLSCWVELLTSPSLMIPVVIDETRELGVVVGEGGGRVLLNYIPAGRGESFNQRVGMSVSTALIGEQLPPGLPIGKIVEQLATTPDGYAVYLVEPGADLSRFYSVSLSVQVQAQMLESSANTN